MFKRWLDCKGTKSILIIGPRRSGKTTYLRNTFPNFKYATLDDLDFLDWAKKDPKGFVSELGKKAIIDEIQRFPRITIAVKYAIDNENACFMMSGSSTIGLLDSAIDTLAGRVEIHSLPTACWGEDEGLFDHQFLESIVNPVNIKQAQRKLKGAITYGQFPEVITQDSEDKKDQILRNYKNTFFIRDVMQISNIENVEGLLSLFRNIARSIGSHLEVSNFARESGLSYPTAKKYLNTLLQSQLTFRLYGYQYGPAKRYIKAAKTYFSDNGIIQSLNVQLSQGQLLENFVIAELEKRRKLGFIKTDQLYYYKSIGGNEIDCVFEIGENIYAIEIKSTSRPGKRDIRNLKDFSEKTEKTVKAYLFYSGKEYGSIEGIQIIPIASMFKGI